MQKNPKNYKEFAKTQTIEAIKNISYCLIIMYFYFNCYLSTLIISVQNYTKILNKIVWATFENHWDLLLREYEKIREKETQMLTPLKSLMETHIVRQSKAQLRKKNYETL